MWEMERRGCEGEDRVVIVKKRWCLILMFMFVSIAGSSIALEGLLKLGSDDDVPRELVELVAARLVPRRNFFQSHFPMARRVSGLNATFVAH
jgi:hypothetical protein